MRHGKLRGALPSRPGAMVWR